MGKSLKLMETEKDAHDFDLIVHRIALACDEYFVHELDQQSLIDLIEIFARNLKYLSDKTVGNLMETLNGRVRKNNRKDEKNHNEGGKLRNRQDPIARGSSLCFSRAIDPDNKAQESERQNRIPADNGLDCERNPR
jgi:hypothetical protein